MLLCRAKFSVQVRDYVDLCATRIADLGQDAARRCKGPETGQTGHDRSPGVEGSGSANRETSHRHGDCSDPTTREVRHICVYIATSNTNRHAPRVAPAFPKSLEEPESPRGHMQNILGASRFFFSIVAALQICWGCAGQSLRQ